MKLTAVLLLGLAICGAAAAECTPGAKLELNAGVAQYKVAKYESAIHHFEAAVTLDESCTVARLYLATAHANMYIPGAETPDNTALAEAAIREFKQVLAAEPKNTSALLAVASLNFQMKRLHEARLAYQQVIDVEPQNAEAYYSIAVIDWTQTYTARMEAKAELKLKPDQPITDTGTCESLRGRFGATVKEGIEMLTRALELRRDYDDAMAYMNLMYREKADYECNDASAREKDLAQADDWVRLTMETKKRKLEAQRPH